MTQEQQDAISDFINEVSGSLEETIDAIHDHMAPDSQRLLGTIRRRLVQASRDFEETMRETS